MSEVADAPRPTGTGAWLLVVLVAVLTVAALVAWSISSVRKPKDHWDEVARARAYLNRGRPDLAFEAVSRIRDEAPGAAEGLTIAARAMLTYGNIAVARRSLERSLAIQPRQAEAARMLAAICLASGDGPRGITLLKQAAELEPSDFRPWYAMGKVYHDLGDLEKSAGAYTEALRRQPPEPEATESRIGRIRAWLDANRQEEATPELAEALSIAPDDPRLLGLAARHASDLGRSANAREMADRALEADPRNFDARLVRGRLNYLAGRWEPALADLDEARRINPNHLGTLQLLGQALARAGRAEEVAEAQDAFRRASERLALMDRLTREINQHPEDPEPRFRMGQAAVEGQMHTLAYQCFQAALDLDPDYKPARDALAKLRAGTAPP
jgi:tetratricopeptide (TPR) repeat protein